MGLLMAPTTEKTTTAGHQDQDQPLFVQGDDDAIYSVRLNRSVPSVARCTSAAPDFSALAVCGSSILGLRKGSPRRVVVLDTVTLAAAPGPRLHSRKRVPVMLAVGDDTVVVMDKVLGRRRDGGSSSACRFEVLRRQLPGDGGWRAYPLPDAPVEDLDDEELELEDEEDLEDYYDNPVPLCAVQVGPYFVKGTRLWISVSDRGTFSLDLSSSSSGAHHAWRVEGSWQLPVDHRIFFVEELGCVVALLPDNWYFHEVCAIDVVEAQKERRPPVVRHVWKFPSEHAQGVPPGEMMDLTYLGNGSFCMARCVIAGRHQQKGTSFTLLDLDFKSLPGAPQLTKRGEPHVHAWPPCKLGFASFL